MAHVAFLWVSVSLLFLTWISSEYENQCGKLLAIIAFLYAGLRGSSVDYDEYIALFELMQDSNLDYPERLFLGKDLLFGSLMAIIQTLKRGPQSLFLAAAAISISLKYLSFRLILGRVTAPMFAAISGYYFLHDFTQIRVAIGFGFQLLALWFAIRERRALFIAFSILSAGFHFSFIFVSIFLLPSALGKRSINFRILYFCAFLFILVTILLPKMEELDARTWIYVGLNVSSISLLIAVLKTFALTAIYNNTSKHASASARNPWADESLWLVQVGTILFLVISQIVPGIAFRVYEIFDAFSILVIGYVLTKGTSKNRAFAFTYCATSLIQMYAGGIFIQYLTASAHSF